MSIPKQNIRTITLILMIVIAAAFRLLSFKLPYIMSNFTPVGAIALFGGAYLTDKWKAYAVVLLTLFTSDILINYFYTGKFILWYSGSFWVYLPFAIMVFIGSLIKRVSFATVGMASLVSVAIHWLITDLPWLYGNSYPHNLAGYGQSLLAAIPFERNMVLGDIVFCAILFGGFELAKNRYTALRNPGHIAV